MQQSVQEGGCQRGVEFSRVTEAGKKLPLNLLVWMCRDM